MVAGLAGPFTGWLIDRHGPRSFYLAGIGLLAVSYLDVRAGAELAHHDRWR